MRFKFEDKNWVEYRNLPDLMEVDFHFSPGESLGTFHDNMRDVHDRTMWALQEAQCGGKQHVLFTHGRSTSRPGKTSARSVVRRVMRSKNATPYLLRARCIQHPSVFVAAIRPLPTRGPQ